MKKIHSLLFFLALIPAALPAQQDPLVSQYMFNGLLLNPAYAGSKEYFSSTLLHRSQWVGWEGAPSTQAFTFHARLKDQVSGVGLTLANDHVGVTNQTDFYANYAYRIPLNDNANLSFGVKGGLSYYSADLNKLIYWDPNDQSFAGGVRTNLLPNAGAGAYFYTDRFYAGLSVPTLMSYDPKELFSIGGNVSSIPKVQRQYYLNVGYAAELTPDLVLKPSILVRATAKAPVQADFNLNLLINRMVWIGASYRTGDAVVGIFEIQATKRFRLGYAYDYTLSDIRSYSAGSHEFMIGYDFGYELLKMKTPRYF